MTIYVYIYIYTHITYRERERDRSLSKHTDFWSCLFRAWQESDRTVR